MASQVEFGYLFSFFYFRLFSTFWLFIFVFLFSTFFDILAIYFRFFYFRLFSTFWLFIFEFLSNFCFWDVDPAFREKREKQKYEKKVSCLEIALHTLDSGSSRS